MPTFAHADHALVIKAQEITSDWYQPHPAIRQHDRVIAETLTKYIPDIDPELIAAAVIAHSFAFIPDGLELEQFLSEQLTARVASIVITLENEYHAVTESNNTARGAYLQLLIRSSPETALVSAVDKTVLLTKLPHVPVDFSEYSGQTLAALKAYYRFFHHYATPYLPPALADELDQLIENIPHKDN